MERPQHLQHLPSKNKTTAKGKEKKKKRRRKRANKGQNKAQNRGKKGRKKQNKQTKSCDCYEKKHQSTCGRVTALVAERREETQDDPIVVRDECFVCQLQATASQYDTVLLCTVLYVFLTTNRPFHASTLNGHPVPGTCTP